MGQLHKPRVLHLFAGAGGGLLADILLGHQCVCAVEIDNYCQQVLVQRQKDGLLPWFPIWDDARTFDGRPWRGLVDIVCAGFPCQPFSVAGQQRGADDERNLWPETIRIIREVGPRFCLLENVRALLAHGYFGTILGDLATCGFDARWRVLSAAECGAPHQRDRLWIVANAKHGRRKRRDEKRERPATAMLLGQWSSKPRMGRMAYECSRRVDRLKSLGNGQVPIVAATAWRLLTQ